MAIALVLAALRAGKTIDELAVATLGTPTVKAVQWSVLEAYWPGAPPTKTLILWAVIAAGVAVLAQVACRSLAN